MKIGIIPAAGRSTRFGGVLKSLLPISQRYSVFHNTLHALYDANVDVINIVYSPDTYESLRVLSKDLPLLNWIQQTDPRDIWGAILAGMTPGADFYYFGMPDTVYPIDIFSRMQLEDYDFALGCFNTHHPERFGTLSYDQGRLWVTNKEYLPPKESGYGAWGVLGWSGQIAHVWRQYQGHIKDYTQAINFAIGLTGAHVLPMDYYYDMATFDDYVNYLKEASSA